ncbi:hypothetical protein PF010_g32338, partial [Phytophthora fragariae]
MLLHALSTSTTAAGATTALLLQAPTSQVGHSLQLRSTHPQDSPPPNQGTGDDESSGVGQDSASRPVSPQPVVSRTGVLDFDAVVDHVRAGVLPSHDRSSPGMQNTPPARFTLPPPRNLVGESFIVGI